MKVGSRAFDLLVALVERRHRLVTKSELLELVWPGLIVEEANLPVAVSGLRKLLGENAIATVPGRGYRFVQPVDDGDGARPDAVHAPGAPAKGPPLYGREDDRRRLIAQVHASRLVTLLGPGGIGKSRLARQVADDLRPAFAGRVTWVELAALSPADRIELAVCRAVDANAGAPDDAVAALVAGLQGAPALLVLDNAEHVVDQVRDLSRRLRAALPDLHLLVTSQRAVRLAGEQQVPLPALSLPLVDGLDAARSSGAVQMFLGQVQAAMPNFSLRENNVASVVDICRRLEGIPLALAFAAARLRLLGLQGLREALDERLSLLRPRTGADDARHPTLEAALDWSHGLLPLPAQHVLRRLAVFSGGFTWQMAQRVGCSTAIDEAAVLDSLETLVDHCMVEVTGDESPRYHLLETTRLYAQRQLQRAGEVERAKESLARALIDALTVQREDERRWHTTPAAGELLCAELHNARSALAWARGQADDRLVIELAARCSYVFLAARLNAEYLEHVLLLRPRVGEAVPRDVAGLFWARIALACSRNAHPAGLDAAERAADIYRALGDAGRLYDALTWAIAIGARLGHVNRLAALIDEAERIERPQWPLHALSSLQWAKHRWWALQGRFEEALECAQRQADLLVQDVRWVAHVALGANVADCETALGRVDAAERRARSALDALDQQGIEDNLIGHVMDSLMVALTLQGRQAEAVALGRRARVPLAREGDDLRLLETLALNAALDGRAQDAALTIGHVDAAVARSGQLRWPAVAARRARLAHCLARSLPAARCEQLLAVGAALPRERAFALAFGDATGG